MIIASAAYMWLKNEGMALMGFRMMTKARLILSSQDTCQMKESSGDEPDVTVIK
jgi:hypothetical protein